MEKNLKQNIIGSKVVPFKYRQRRVIIVRNHQRKHPEKYHAYLLSRKLIRVVCSVEGCVLLGEKHHPDYSKGFEVISLCKQHHADEHVCIRKLQKGSMVKKKELMLRNMYLLEI